MHMPSIRRQHSPPIKTHQPAGARQQYGTSHQHPLSLIAMVATNPATLSPNINLLSVYLHAHTSSLSL